MYSQESSMEDMCQLLVKNYIKKVALILKLAIKVLLVIWGQSVQGQEHKISIWMNEGNTKKAVSIVILNII